MTQFESIATPIPTPIGLRPSFGFGDRLGRATGGHIDAVKGTPFVPVFAQQSVREMTRTGRSPEEIMAAAAQTLAREVWRGDWGADADHVKTRADVGRLAAAGYTLYTIDPSEYVHDGADTLRGGALHQGLDRVVKDGAFSTVAEVEELYLGKIFEGVANAWRFNREELFKTVVKYGAALAHVERMAAWIEAFAPVNGYEIEVSVDETPTATTALDHVFIARELRRRAVRAVSVAPRFIGTFEKGIDYKGDVAAFEASLREHMAIARTFGPHKISVHSGSDKFSIYPVLGRECGDLLHVKTAGTSYLEALRVVARVDDDLFREIAVFALKRFDEDRASYQLSANPAELALPSTLRGKALERNYLDTDTGRQVLHVTYGSVLRTGETAKGQPFKEALETLLDDNAVLHRELVGSHLGRHVRALLAG